MQKGKDKAFEALYERYYLPLCKKAFLRIPSVQRVEEIVQDVFVNLWAKTSSLDAGGNVRAYLYATLRNKILHELRTESTRLFYAEEIKKQKQRQDGSLFLGKIYARETETYITQIIQSLPAQCREAFRLSRYEYLSYKEIAERMQLSTSTVEKHVGKALRILRTKLNTPEDVYLLLPILLMCCL